jgi:hypothetical protein
MEDDEQAANIPADIRRSTTLRARIHEYIDRARRALLDASRT